MLIKLHDDYGNAFLVNTHTITVVREGCVETKNGRMIDIKETADEVLAMVNPPQEKEARLVAPKCYLPPLDESEKKNAQTGHIIDAIKSYRGRTGEGLKNSKRAVDHYREWPY